MGCYSCITLSYVVVCCHMSLYAMWPVCVITFYHTCWFCITISYYTLLCCHATICHYMLLPYAVALLCDYTSACATVFYPVLSYVTRCSMNYGMSLSATICSYVITRYHIILPPCVAKCYRTSGII